MRRIVLHILGTVLGASVACILGIVLLVHNIDIISNQYEENISRSIQSQRTMDNISSTIYRTESLVWQHIVSEQDVEYTQYEEQINELLSNMSDLFSQLDESIEDEDDSAMLHTVIKQYVGFRSNTDVVLELSRKGSKQSAQYYVEMKLNPYFDTVNETLDEIDQNMEDKGQRAASEMEDSIRAARLVATLCLAVVVFVIVTCLAVVARHGRLIMDRQAEELQSHQQRVMALQYKTIVGMANLIEGRDEDTGEHVKRTSWFVDRIARKLDEKGIYRDEIDDEFLENLWKAAPLHDIGKIKVPDAILKKPGKLTDEEFEIMKSHAVQGGQIVYETMDGIEERQYIEMAHNVAKYHHEKWNGTGYPEGLSGEAIPLCARIMAVADVFDALTSKRCYKPAMSIEEAFRIIEESAGSHFDPVVAAAFLELRPEVEQYLQELKNSDIKH